MAWLAEGSAKPNNVTIKWERVTSQNLNDRVAAAVMTSAGPALCFYQHNLAHLYRESLADVSDVALEARKAVEGFFKDREKLCRVDGVWPAVPFQYGQTFFHYHDNWLKRAGV
jgi:ABC-type glycerol-3-phosphate transport system substrate-binding protein